MSKSSKKSAVEARPPFTEGDLVEYLAAPQRRFRVHDCFARKMAGVRRWVVTEINADSHDAADLRLVEKAPRPKSGGRSQAA